MRTESQLLIGTLHRIVPVRHLGSPHRPLADLEQPCDLWNWAVFVVSHALHLVLLCRGKGRGPAADPAPLTSGCQPFLGPL